MADRLADGLHQLTRSIEAVLRVLLGVLLGLLTLLLFIQVVLRFGFNDSIRWAEEVPRIMLTWLVFVGIVPTVKGQHLIIDVLPDKYPLRVLSTAIKWLFFLFLLIWGAELVTKVVNQKMPITGISRAWQYGAVPVGGALAMIVGFDEIVRMIRGGPDAGPEVVAGGLTEEGWASASVD